MALNSKKTSVSKLILKIDNKLGLFTILNKSIPIIIICTSILIGSIIYISNNAFYPDSGFSLPQTGEETSDNFSIESPKSYSEITLPERIIGFSQTGYYSSGEKITFYGQKSKGNIFKIGEGVEESTIGHYQTVWDGSSKGLYMIWAEITLSDGALVRSPYIYATVK